MSAQFNIAAVDPDLVQQLQEEYNLPSFIATTLVARGIKTKDEAYRFLHPSFEDDWHNPYEIADLEKVASILEDAIRNDKHIVVFGDFDVDGISATAVLTRGLRALGAYVTPFIPHRFEEGYGITDASRERLAELKPELVVTVDCGISCRDQVKTMLNEGIDVVITDHHEAGDDVPEGVCVVDPKAEENNPSEILAGVGVALKLVQALGARFGYPNLWKSYTDLATLGTVADLMPMLGENRALVADGIRRMNENPRPCIAALMGTAGVADKELTASNLSFTLIPRLNASGRMGDADLALNLLMTDDFDEACTYAEELEHLNEERRSIEAELSEMAKEQAQEIYHGQRVLVVSGEGWHEGVKGIVASRLVRTYGVPCLLFTVEGNEAHGSGRSVGQVNLFEAVESTADILTRFGGHQAAVGVTLPADKLEEFTRRLNDYMDGLPEEDFHPLTKIDACVSLAELTIPNVELLDQLAPFGQENPTPVFLARNVELSRGRAVGADKNHFSCTLSDGTGSVDGIMFHCTDISTLLTNTSVVNAAFEVQIDEWRGRRSVKALLQSLAPAHACQALEACLNPKHVQFFAELYATSDAELCETSPENAEDLERYDEERRENRSYWQNRAREFSAELEEEIIETIIHEGSLHESQRTVLRYLDEGKSTIAVMATGRGKSLTFQVHAALNALRDNKASLLVYPLRALIADQAYHLEDTLRPFGINVGVLTGESTPDERRRIFDMLTTGDCDLVLTTPEFLNFHCAEFAATKRINFVVVDEAHHIGLARAGQRLAYAEIGDSVRQICENPLVLAVTATADADIARSIVDTLPIEVCVFDDTVRENLNLDDQRGIKNRDAYLAKLVARGEKTIIYVNSRENSIALARNLRKQVPQLASLIGFYNGGLSRAERTRIETLFRTNHLAVLVATSAFGEGVNIPNIKHVVLYNLPYNAIEFNQISGRAGRDGTSAYIHLLFNKRDADVNKRILADMTPGHDELAEIYRSLRDLQRQCPDCFFTISDEKLGELASKPHHEISARGAACGIAVFRELGLIETHTAYNAGILTRSIHVVHTTEKVELTDSVRYREGIDERDMFEEFSKEVFERAGKDLELAVAHPIVPACAGSVCASARVHAASDDTNGGL